MLVTLCDLGLEVGQCAELPEVVFFALREEFITEEILYGRIKHELDIESGACALWLADFLELLAVDQREDVHAHLPIQIVGHMATFCIRAFEVLDKLRLDVVLEDLSDHIEDCKLDFARLQQKRPQSGVKPFVRFENSCLRFFGVWLFLQLSDVRDVFFDGSLHRIAHPLYALDCLPDYSDRFSGQLDVAERLGVACRPSTIGDSAISCLPSEILTSIGSTLAMRQSALGIETNGLLRLLDRMIFLQCDEARVILHYIEEFDEVALGRVME